jgi:integrase
MVQRGQVFKLTSRNADGGALWAYRYRSGGRESERVQRGGFASEGDARAALEQALEKLRRAGGTARVLTLAELVEQYLAQHEAAPVTLEKLRWLLVKAVAAFGDRSLGELRSAEIAAWRMTIPAGYRFEATQALRQVLARAVVWGMLEVNPAKHGVENPQRRRTEKRPFESWEELEAVVERLGRYGPMVLFAAATGLRPSEWIALEQRDIDREARVACPPCLQQGNAPVHEDGSERARRAAAGERARGARPACDPIAGGAPVSRSKGRLPRPAQLPQPQLETGPDRRRHRTAPPRLRSPPHLRHLRLACRHLNLRFSPATGAPA